MSFDKDSHKIFFQKLAALSLHDHTVVKCCLPGLVLISSDNNSNITYRTPQESILGRHLFRIYVYDMQAVLLEHSCMLIIRFKLETAKEI